MQRGLEMCVHYWMLDSSDKGICKLCGKQKGFSPRPERLTKQEKREIEYPFNRDFYLQGNVCLNKTNVQ